jgi:phosphohistidine phosphatase
MMQLILWRHADAEDPGGKPDTERNLTKKGRAQAAKMAGWLSSRIDKDWRILVSPARRTLQTVEPLGLPHEQADAVGLAATAETLLDAAGWPDAKRNVVVVGHQPTLGEAAALLLGSEEGLSFRKGAIWWFTARERDGRQETVLKLVMTPEEAEDAAK